MKILILVALIVACAESDHHPKWGYAGANGPEHWGEMSPGYALCEAGSAQSPIDLDSSARTAPAEIDRRYEPAILAVAHQEHVVDVLDNGHTIQVTYDEGSTLREQGREFELRQYHFHAPSEHTIDGRHYSMEMHLVHSSADGEFAVLGVLITEGEHNDAFESVWENLPRHPGETRHIEHVEVDVSDLLPDDDRYYRYEGSLTTPPCSEGVHWYVIPTPVMLSREQIAAFAAIFPDNHRPVRPRNGREVTLLVAEPGSDH